MRFFAVDVELDFTRVGRIIAHIFFGYGMVGVVYALFAGFTAFDYPEEKMAQATWVTREVGEAMTLAFMGLALGVLCEISAKLTNLVERAK